MKHSTRSHIWSRGFAAAAVTLAAITLAACGGSNSETENPAPAPAPESAARPQSPPAPAPAPQPQPAETAAPAQEAPAKPAVEVRDDTPEAAIETWVSALRVFDFDAALAVLDPESRGAEMLRTTKAGYERAISDPAVPVALMQTAIAGEIQNLSWEMSAIDGESATFRFSSKSKTEPWEIRVVRTPDGWRVIPPPNGLPQG